MSEVVKKETWKNATLGSIGILKLDVRGIEQGTVVRAGKTVSLTVDERRLNQDHAASKAKDLFSNGALTPIRLIDDEQMAESAEYKEIEDNPNFISEDEMRALFTSKRIDVFRKKLADIENINVLNRIAELAASEDAKVSQVEAIEKRLAELRPNLVIEVQTVGGSPDRAMKPSTS